MPNRWKNQRKESFPSGEAGESHDHDLPEMSSSVVQELLKAQEGIMKLFMESVVASITSRIDDLVKDVAELKASLQFSQRDISSHEEKIKLIDTDVSNLQATINKHLQKTVYVENQSRRNNLPVLKD